MKTTNVAALAESRQKASKSQAHIPLCMNHGRNDKQTLNLNYQLSFFARQIDNMGHKKYGLECTGVNGVNVRA
jgi:hypothetical protein